MDEYAFDDVLTGGTVTFAGLRLGAAVSAGVDAGAPRRCATLFFPGCSLLNYALPLVQSVYDLLREADVVEGISLLCCGKILSFEPDGANVRAAFEDELRDHVAAAGVERIVAACPNCVAALSAALAADERTAHVQVVALPGELAKLGYRIDAEVARRMLGDGVKAYAAAGCGAGAAATAGDDLKFCVHDSCPDRESGAFADGVRALLPPELVVEAAHIRKKSFCCGSLLRAAGKFDAADKQARRHGEEAVEVQAAGIVTACVSCAFQLSMAQTAVPVFHYLELLYDWRVDWRGADQYMKLRFLFDEPDEAGSGRAYAGLAGEAADAAGAAAKANGEGEAR
ncbi:MULTISPECIES: heterodisulfide reductase-related iron-sulfur binding cluster [Gordonibacter]|uniref:Heterodisulfide reductase-related iron-sulfur binding cluster n=1 Tax=Gordonibacter faecis TaxID=3047475 RepID=A0ABT7DMF5_9ACTN|nr:MULTISPECIES: heterodisulfide reductase-related iron-sulfur binding cluster [unclassified Gordonibacter]MDJ1650713.1 heterodisulfide reductase-related iron-sulfur binding cluster [Gordonibacter sp. KGMB12511]HIW77490.1 hypothetical protein [Candidatus Gordonibacter avicola]